MFDAGGRQSREVHVTVQSLPEVSVMPPMLPFTRGDNLTVSCISQGFPYPTLAWWKDDESLAEAMETLTEQKVNLHVLFATQEDEGEYTCTATASSGTGTLRPLNTKSTSPMNYTTASPVHPVTTPNIYHVYTPD